jgi:hypothetical protein
MKTELEILRKIADAQLAWREWEDHELRQSGRVMAQESKGAVARGELLSWQQICDLSLEAKSLRG